MNPDTVQILSIAGAFIAGAFAYYWDVKKPVDKKKKIKYRLTTFGIILIPTLSIVFFFAIKSTINSRQESKKSGTSLDSILNKSKSSLKKIDSVLSSSSKLSDSLSQLKEESIILDKRMRDELAVQLQVNEAAKFLVDNIVHERKQIVRSNKFELKSAIDQLGWSYSRIWLSLPSNNLSKSDSIKIRDQLIDYTIYSISLLRGQLQNPELLKNEYLYGFWRSVKDRLSNIQFKLYGYNLTSLQKVGDELYKVSEMLRKMDDSYQYEDYFKSKKNDTNLYPIPKDFRNRN